MGVTPFGRPDMLVGQPLKIVMAYTTAIVQCQCEGKTLLMLAAINRPVQCPICGKQFAIINSGDVQVAQVQTPDVPAIEVAH